MQGYATCGSLAKRGTRGEVFGLWKGFQMCPVTLTTALYQCLPRGGGYYKVSSDIKVGDEGT